MSPPRSFARVNHMTIKSGIVIAVFTASAAAACSSPAPREYQLTGQILGLKPEAREVLVKHDEIEGFMAAMTMPYKVKDLALLEGRQPGDLITATLLVSESEGVLSSIIKTGSAPLDQPPPAETVTPIEVLIAGEPLPEALLVDQTGTARAFSSFRGHRLALTFIYTTCPMPDFCPLMDRNFAAVQNLIEKSPAMSDVRLLSITIDPARDTPPILAAHAARLKADPVVWSFLTGDEAELSRFAAQFGLAVVRNGDDPSDIAHTLRTAVIDAEGRLSKTHTGNSWTPAELFADLSAVPAPAQ